MQLYTKILIGMGVGVFLGVAVGPNSHLLPASGVVLSPQATVRTAPQEDAPIQLLATNLERAQLVDSEIAENTPWSEIRFRLSPTDRLRLIQAGVQGVTDLPPDADISGWVQLDAPTVKRYAPIGQYLINATEWVGRLFLALIKMVVIPLVFFSLTVGIASLGDFRRLGRMGGRTLLLFTTTTILALSIGMGLGNLIGPGRFISEDDRDALLASYQGEASSTVNNAATSTSFVDQLVGIVPANPLASLAEGNMLQIIFFALMFGIALTLLPNERSRAVVQLMDDANEAMVMLVHIAMKLAPVGVAALLFKVVGSTGLSVLYALMIYAMVVLLGLAIHLSLVYGSVVRFGAQLPFLSFLGAMRPALLVAFGTASSSATLPVTKECVEDNINVSNEVSSFVLPLGATVNMDGTALYQGVAAMFIAQIYSIPLSFSDQLTIVTSATLASVGAAGVPGAGMVTLAMVLTAVGVPTEGIALVLGVDRLLDMFRTATNVVGDSAATVLIARLEGNSLQVLQPEEDRANKHKGFEGRLDHKPQSVQRTE
ncbi:MAG: dicarboxylate/amino acid:cation symporter [Myxococcales bacterium]|nr:dicarboxylate/amino acid:cation symporter [Myxococcales bacterium]